MCISKSDSIDQKPLISHYHFDRSFPAGSQRKCSVKIKTIPISHRLLPDWIESEQMSYWFCKFTELAQGEC